MNNDENLKSISSELEKISSNISQLKEEKENIVAGIKKDIKNWYKKWIVLVIGGFSLLTLYALFQIYTTVIHKSEEFITNSITVKFAEPQISKKVK